MMELDEETEVNDFGGGGGDGFFGELTSSLSRLVNVPCTQMDVEQLSVLGSYIKQATDCVRASQVDEAAVNETFQITALASKLCLGFDEVKSSQEKAAAASEEILSKLREIFYLATELFAASTSLCLSKRFTVTRLADIHLYVRNCQKLDIKIFLQSSKTFISVLDANKSILSSDKQRFSVQQFIDFLQSIIFSDLLLAQKRTATAVKVVGFIMKNLAQLYSSYGAMTLAESENVNTAVKFLVNLHGVYFDYASSGSDAETLTTAFSQFVLPSLLPVVQSLLRHESFLNCLLEFDHEASSRTAWIALVVNIFACLSDTRTVSQTNDITQLLEVFMRKFCAWSVDETATRQWPWPLVSSVTSKPQSAHLLCAIVVSKLVLTSVLEEATQFFNLEQVLFLALTGRVDEGYPTLARVFAADVFAMMSKASLKLSLRYTALLAELIIKSGETDDVSCVLMPSLLRRIFDNVVDDQKAKLIEGALDELVRSFPSVVVSSGAGRRSSGVYSMTEAFRMLEACTTALTKTPPIDRPVQLLTATVRLFAYLTWWTSSSPEMLKSCKSLLEKITFAMWAILSMTSPSNDAASHPLLVLLAQSVFEASKASIIGVNNFETSAKFWQAAAQFFDIATLPTCVRQLFVVWLLKAVDSNTLASCPGAQKVLENCLATEEKPSLMHAVVLSNLANRLTLKNAPLAKLCPRLRIQAEAFSQQLFCVPFSKISLPPQD